MRAIGTIVAALVFALLLGNAGFAAIRRVPRDYLTIQQALNALAEDDTVLVATGIYRESLSAPSLRFAMIGDVEENSADSLFPVIDPSLLPNSDTLACLRLGASPSVYLSQLRFRNGPEMHDSISVYYVGGISHGADSLVVSNCIFDSVRRGIFSVTRGEYVQPVDVFRSQFNHASIFCIYTSGRVHAEDCSFNGHCSEAVHGNRCSVVRRCTFTQVGLGNMIVMGGDSLLVEDCVFGPDSIAMFTKVALGLFNGTRTSMVRDCIFSDLALGSQALEIAMNCPNAAALPFIIGGNTFQSFNWNLGQGGLAIIYNCQGGLSGYFGRLDTNVFQDGVSNIPWGTGVTAQGFADMHSNRFTRLDPPESFDVYSFEGSDTMRIRACYFDEDGRAVGYESGSQTVMDARENWWGDSTGPYHPTRNPQGQGGEIMPDVLFEPWIHDTLELAVERKPLPIPRADQLEVYPNPFNAATTIRLAVREPGIYRLDLFDITGRLTREIWTGPAAYQRDIKFDAGALPSGVYVLRARRVPQGNNIVLAKMVIMK